MHYRVHLAHSSLLDGALQIVLSVSQIMWCQGLTVALSSEQNILEAVKGCEQNCFEVR